MNAPFDRRAFLRGFAKLPLIGGTLAIVGAPSAPVSLVQAATLSGIPDPRERARLAWDGFVAAMDEVAAGLDGWRVQGGSRLTALPHSPILAAGTWGTLSGVRYAYEDRGHFPFASEHGVDLGMRL